MNFYQSGLRKTINSDVLGKPVMDIELFGKTYRGTLKQQKHLGKTLRRWMVQGVEFQEGITEKKWSEQVDALKSQLVHGWGDFLIQLGCANIMDRSTTHLVKEKELQKRLHDQKEALQIDLLQKFSLEKGLRTHMPDATIILDLHLDEKDYRAQLSTSGKRYINKGKKANLVFTQATSEQRAQFREVRYTTGFDKGFHVLPKDQFLKLRDFCLSEETGTLFVGIQDGKIVTGALYLFYGKQMIYLYGATDRSYGDIGAQYRLTDQIIRRGKETYASLDLLGVAPVGFEKGHDREGVTRFKQAFGGETISYRGSYDIIFNSWVMKAFERKRKMGR